jgi:hypothetical protein
VWTGSLSANAKDPDLLDITRKTAEARAAKGLPSPGAFLAPSRELLNAGLRFRAEAEHAEKMAVEHGGLFGTPEVAAAWSQKAQALRVDGWAFYEPLFLDELRVRYRKSKHEWLHLLNRERVVLACFCGSPTHCHRRLAAEVLAKLGATYEGEIVR